MNIDFEKEFESIILMRGFSIYAKGNVTNVKKDGDIITAVVYGSSKYSVHVEIVNNQFLHGGCSARIPRDAITANISQHYYII